MERTSEVAQLLNNTNLIIKKSRLKHQKNIGYRF